MTIIVTGCQSTPELIEFQQDPIDIKAERPLDRCVWPELIEAEMNGQTILYMSVEGLAEQRACQVIEQKNYVIANNSADSVDAAVTAFNSLIKKSEIHMNHAENELERVNSDRNSKAMEVLGYQGLLALVLIAVAL